MEKGHTLCFRAKSQKAKMPLKHRVWLGFWGFKNLKLPKNLTMSCFLSLWHFSKSVTGTCHSKGFWGF